MQFDGFPDHVRVDWARSRYSVIRDVFTRATCAGWELETRHLPTRQTCFPGHPQRWAETSYSGSDWAPPCDGLIADPRFLGGLGRATGIPGLSAEGSMTWINRYQPGDEVPEHVDADGDLQLLICLQAPPEPQRGGQTMIQGREVPLATGDVLLWKATLLPHGMSRIESPRLGESGASRVVCVFRLRGAF